MVSSTMSSEASNVMESSDEEDDDEKRDVLRYPPGTRKALETKKGKRVCMCRHCHEHDDIGIIDVVILVIDAPPKHVANNVVGAIYREITQRTRRKMMMGKETRETPKGKTPKPTPNKPTPKLKNISSGVSKKV